MAGHDRPPPYCAFLLRCWQERSTSNPELVAWRFSLEDPHTGARRGFASLAAVVAAVQDALASDESPRPSDHSARAGKEEW